MANDEWYYARGNQQQGPVPLQQLQDLLRTGQLQPNDLVWRNGMANWQSASQVPDVYAGMGAATPSAPVPAYAPPQAPAPTYAPPGAQPQFQNPGYYAPQQVYPPGTVPNYLVFAILATAFCCLPFGIVSIVFAAQVNSKLALGDYHGAVDASNKAKTWAWVSFGCGMVAVVLWVGLVILGAVADSR